MTRKPASWLVVPLFVVTVIVLSAVSPYRGSEKSVSSEDLFSPDSLSMGDEPNEFQQPPRIGQNRDSDSKAADKSGSNDLNSGVLKKNSTFGVLEKNLSDTNSNDQKGINGASIEKNTQYKISEPILNISARVMSGRKKNLLEQTMIESNYATVAADSIQSLDLYSNPLRVFMYNIPPEFYWGMLWHPRRPTIEVYGQGVFNTDICPNNSDPYWKFQGKPGNFSARVPVFGGTPIVRQFSAEYFLLLSLYQGLPSILRVPDPKDAQILFVPFFASKSYNHYTKFPKINAYLQARFMDWMSNQTLWKLNKGRKHLIVTHHPQALGFRMDELNNTMLIVADFSRLKSSGSYSEKDVVAPYIPFVKPFTDDKDSETSWSRRNVLAFFQGGFKRKKGGYIREKLKTVLENEEGFLMVSKKPSRKSIPEAQMRLRSSKFCLMPAGDTPSSCRLYDSIQSLCVPVVISQAIELPFEDILDYTQFCLFVPTYKALTPGYLPSLLRNVTKQQWTAMHTRLNQVRHHFVYKHPATPEGAEDMIWQSVRRKLAGFQPASYRTKRQKIQELRVDLPSRYV